MQTPRPALDPTAQYPDVQPVMFGGEKGAANVRAPAGPGMPLAAAQDLASKGTSDKDIFYQTGWFRGVDGTWQWVLPDTSAALNRNRFDVTPAKPEEVIAKPIATKTAKSPGYTRPAEPEKLTLKDGEHLLQNVLHHPSLYDTYPQLGTATVKRLSDEDAASGVNASYNPGTNTVELAGGRSEKELTSSLLHELQHGVQATEGFAPGGNAGMFLSNDFYDRSIAVRKNLQGVHSEVAKTLGNDDAHYLRSLLERSLVNDDTNPNVQAVISKLQAKLPANVYDNLEKAVAAEKPIQQERDAAYQQYRSLAGEVQSRKVEKEYQTQDYNQYPPEMPGFAPGTEQIIRQYNTKPKYQALPPADDPYSSAGFVQGQPSPSPAQEGRGSDTITGHLTPGDLVVPQQAQTPEVMGAIGNAFQQQNQDVSAYTAGSPNQNINPNTGYPEFQMPPYDDTEDSAVSGPSAPVSPATPATSEPATEAPVLTPSQIPAQPQPAIGATSLTGSVKPDEVGDQPSPQAMPPTTPMSREMQAPEEKPPGEPVQAPPAVFRGTPGPRSAIGEQPPFPIKQPRIPVPAETYKDLRSNDPALYDSLNKVGSDVGVSPIDLAQLIKLSSDTDPSYKDDNGRVGYFAISPDEQKRIDPKQTLDINNPIQNLYMGALKWKEAEDEFGRGSKNAVAAFYAGPDVVKRMLQRPDASHEIALANAPGVWKFIDAFMGRKPGEEEQPPEGAVTSAGLPTAAGTPQEGGGIIGARVDARELTVPPTVPYTVSPPPPVDQGGVRGPVSGAGGARDVVVPPTVPYTASPPPPPDLGGVRGPVSGPGGARELVVPPTVVPPQAAPAVPSPAPGPPPVLQGRGAARGYPPGTVVNPETGEPEPPGGLQPTGTPADEYGWLGRAIGNALPAITVQPEGVPGAQAAQDAAAAAAAQPKPPATPAEQAAPGALALPQVPSAADRFLRSTADLGPAPVTTGSATTPQARTPAEATAPSAPPPTPPPGTPSAPRSAAGTPAEAVPPPPSGVPGPGASVVPGASAPAPTGETTSLDNNSKPGTADPDAAMAAAKAGGPVGLLSYVTYDAAPSNTTPSNGFAALRLAIYRKAALTDNWAAAGAAIELMTREQHAGSFDDLKRAYGAMGAKDWSAATYFLARSHAFVEDGAFIKFGVSGDKVYGQRYSEVTHQPMGGPFQVTQQNLMDNMRIVADPVKWAELVDKEKKTNEEIVHNQMLEAQARQNLEFQAAHANQTVQAEAQRVGVQQTEANRRAAEQHQISLYDAAQRVQANVEATNARLGAQQETQARAAAAADKELLEQGILDPSSKNPLTNENGSTWDQEQLDRSKQIYKALRMNNTEQTVDQAKTLTKGLVSQTKESTPGNPVTTMKLAPLVDAQGRTTGFTVLDQNGHPRAYLSPQSLRGTAIPEVERALAANPPPTGPRQVPNITMPPRPMIQPPAPVVFNPPAIGVPRRITRDQMQAR